MNNPTKSYQHSQTQQHSYAIQQEKNSRISEQSQPRHASASPLQSTEPINSEQPSTNSGVNNFNYQRQIFIIRTEQQIIRQLEQSIPIFYRPIHQNLFCANIYSNSSLNHYNIPYQSPNFYNIPLLNYTLPTRPGTLLFSNTLQQNTHLLNSKQSVHLNNLLQIPISTKSKTLSFQILDLPSSNKSQRAKIKKIYPIIQFMKLHSILFKDPYSRSLRNQPQTILEQFKFKENSLNQQRFQYDPSQSPNMISSQKSNRNSGYFYLQTISDLQKQNNKYKQMCKQMEQTQKALQQNTQKLNQLLKKMQNPNKNMIEILAGSKNIQSQNKSSSFQIQNQSSQYFNRGGSQNNRQSVDMRLNESLINFEADNLSRSTLGYLSSKCQNSDEVNAQNESCRSLDIVNTNNKKKKKKEYVQYNEGIFDKCSCQVY